MTLQQSAAIDEAIRGGLRYLVSSQRASGEFPTYWSLSLTMTEPTYAESPFITGMIVLALSSLKTVEVKIIRRRAIAYLITKRKSQGFFSFFDNGIDPDVDDTCLLNWILQSANSNPTFYRALAEKILQRPQQDGFYGTWIREIDDSVSDIDPCVNVNVLRFLHGNGLTNDATIQALQTAMRTNAYADGTIYYEPTLSLPYLILTLPAVLVNQILDAQLLPILQRRQEESGTANSGFVVDAAMELFILSSAKGDLSRSEVLADFLLSQQTRDGGWPSSSMFRAFNYWGSAELTTAVVVQALNRYTEGTNVKQDEIRDVSGKT